MKAVLTKEEVGKAISHLVGQGKRPTLAALHAALDNRGSMTTLVRLKAEIDAATRSATDSPEALEVFRKVWALARDEERKEQDRQMAELRESIKALAAENERLEEPPPPLKSGTVNWRGQSLKPKQHCTS